MGSVMFSAAVKDSLTGSRRDLPVIGLPALKLRGRAAPVVIHGVQHIFYPPVELPAWPDDDRRSKIVFITRDIARQTIEKTLRAFIEVWQGQGSSCAA